MLAAVASISLGLWIGLVAQAKPCVKSSRMGLEAR